MALVGIACLVAWACATTWGGAMDLGNNPGTAGPRGAVLMLMVLAPLGAWALWQGARRGDAITRVVLAAAWGLAAWSGLSAVWAPDAGLAWLATNRAAMVAAAVAVGAAVAVAVPRAVRAFPVALSVAAVVPVGAALATAALPGLLGVDGADGRLTDPIGHPNVLALVAALALPGALVGPRTARGLPTGPWLTAWASACIATVALTLSRGGYAAAATAVLLTLATADRPRAAVGRAITAALGAVPAVVVALSADAFTADGLDASARAGAGARFGLALVAGAAAAAWLVPRAMRAIPRGTGRAGAARRVAVVLGVACAAAPGAVALAQPATWDCGRGFVDNATARVTSLSSNQRGAWWCEAYGGWRAAPVAGNGAGSFPLVERRERRDGNDLLTTRDPHEMWLETASATGLVGVALLGAMWGLGLWRITRRWSALPPGLAAVPLAALGQAQSDWVLSWPAAAVPAAAALGLVVATRRRGRTRPAAHAARTVAAAGLAVTATALVASAWLPFLSARAALASEDALVRGDASAALRSAQRAGSLNPLALDPLFAEARARQAGGDTAGERAVLREATRRQPDNPEAWTRLAAAAERARSAREARAAWRQVARLDPHSERLPGPEPR